MNEQRKANLQTRKDFMPIVGEIYKNEGGGQFICECVYPDEKTARFKNINSNWSVLAHGIGRYADGTIDWDFSTYGFFNA